MRKLDQQDLNWVLRTLPRAVVELMQEHGTRLVLSGGFIRSSVSGERANDIDLFCKSAEDAKLFADKLAGGKKKVMGTGNAYSLRKVGGHFVQFIHRWTYDNPPDILESFDFTIACASVWYDPRTEVNYNCDGAWCSLVDDNFYSDLAAKRLVYRAPKRNEDAGGSMLRVLKFYQRGFRIPLDSLGAVIARLVDGVEYKQVEVVAGVGESSIGGATTEERWAKIITGLLRVVDPAVDPEHESHLPSGAVEAFGKELQEIRESEAAAKEGK